MTKAKILIVEDDRIVAIDLKISLENLDYIVPAVVTSGSEALIQIKKHNPDLVIIDIVLEEEMDGIQIAKQINNHFNIPIIYCTSYADLRTLERAKKTEPHGYILKPFEERELRVVIETALHKYKMEVDLKESEEKYRNLVDNINDGVYILDKHGIFTFVNKVMQERIGISLKTFKTTSFLDTIDPTYRTAVRKNIERVMKGESVSPYELAFITKKGRPMYVEVNTRPIFKNDTVVGLQGISRDITDRKKSEEDLRESEERFRSLYENSTIGLYRTTADGKIVMANPALVHLLGFSSFKELSQRNLEEEGFEPSYSRLEFKKSIEEKGEIVGLEAAWKRRNGKILHVRESAKVYRDEKGRIQYYEGTVEDITEKKRAEEGLKEYQRAVESSKDLIAAVDRDYRYLLVNEAFLNYHHLRRSDVIGNAISDVLGKDMFENTIKPRAEQCLKGKTVQHEITHAYPKLGKRELEISYFPLKKTDKSIKGFVEIVRDITERKQTEAALKESEEKYRLLVENANEIIAVAQEGVIKFINPRIKEILGYTPEKVNNINFSQYIHPDDRKTVMENFQNRLKGHDAPKSYNLRVIDKNKNIKWLSANAVLIPWENKPATLAFLTDITERKNAEEALRESEQRYRQVVENLNEGVWLIDEDSITTFVNDRMAEMLGFTIDEMIGKHLFFFMDEEGIKTGQQYLDRRRDGIKESHDFEFLKKDGSKVYVLLEASPIFDENGQYKGAIAGVMDITERKRIEKALKQSEQQYKSLYSMVRLMCDNVPDLIWAKDMNKRFIFANKAVCHRLLNAKNTDEPIGKTDIYFANRERQANRGDPDYHTFGEICQDSDEAVMKSKKPERFDEFGNIKGKFLYLDVHKAPFWDEHKNCIGTVGCGRDVTKEKKLEDERKQFELELIKSREVLRKLFANLQSVREEERKRISREIHDELGQALTALKMDLYWLDNKLVSDNKVLHKKTTSMLNLLDTTIQRVKKLSADLRPGLLDDLGLVAAIEWQAGEFQDHTGIKCRVTFQPEDISIDADKATAIFRIFQETLTNIARHARATAVNISLKKKNDEIILRVKDNGIGITQKQIADTTSLGLIGMKERVFPFKGKLTIVGEKAKGTTLSVILPLKEIETAMSTCQGESI
jgi:PAS domain S-box-containing protein